MSGRRCRSVRRVWIKFLRAIQAQTSVVSSIVIADRQGDLGKRMDLFEYQAKELFAKHDVPTTPGRVTDSADDAKAIAEEIGKPVMVKAQVKVGGRGKAGGVKYAATPDDAFG